MRSIKFDWDFGEVYNILPLEYSPSASKIIIIIFNNGVSLLPLSFTLYLSLTPSLFLFYFFPPSFPLTLPSFSLPLSLFSPLLLSSPLSPLPLSLSHFQILLFHSTKHVDVFTCTSPTTLQYSTSASST